MSKPVTFLKHHWLLIALLVLAYIYRQRLLSFFATTKASLSNVAANIVPPASVSQAGGAAAPSNNPAPAASNQQTITKTVQDVTSTPVQAIALQAGDVARTDAGRIRDIMMRPQPSGRKVSVK